MPFSDIQQYQKQNLTGNVFTMRLKHKVNRRESNSPLDSVTPVAIRKSQSLQGGLSPRSNSGDMILEVEKSPSARKSRADDGHGGSVNVEDANPRRYELTVEYAAELVRKQLQKNVSEFDKYVPGGKLRCGDRSVSKSNKYMKEFLLTELPSVEAENGTTLHLARTSCLMESLLEESGDELSDMLKRAEATIQQPRL